MGAEQSQPEQPEKPVRIERSEIPEAYYNVAVSDNVVRRVRSERGAGAVDEEKRRLEEQLQRERENNHKLRMQMQQLSDLQQRHSTNIEVQPAKKESISLDDMQERNRVFDDTVDRVKKQFFSFQRENACDGTEKEILSCLEKNNGKHLKCQSLLPKYHECIEKFREEVLAQKR
uniref:Uncharacterized protein n=1 Tax=Acrobeloides nanus TaxID=290746 RepID=A0A914EHL1_9BILA